MKRTAIALLLISLASPLFAGSIVVANHAALATASPHATQIGLAVLRQGGNAIDAAVAVAFALAVAEPEAGNLGGGGFLVYYEASTRGVWTLDFREVAPAAATHDTKLERDGALAAAVPGTVAGLAAMHERFGTRPWKELVGPAIELAANGVRVSSDLALARSERKVDFAGAGGTILVQKELAATLERIATKGASDFYEGELAARIVDGVRKSGGILSLRDLRDYKPMWRAPFRILYRDFDIYTVPAPSAAGLMMAEELNILSGYDIAATGLQTAAGIHLMAEAERRAALDRDRHVGDPASARLGYRDLLSPERAAQWRASINPAHVTPTLTLNAPPIAVAERAHTTHFTIVDSSGNIAAITTSLGDAFGSGFLVPQCGFFLNNAMRDFVSAPASAPNVVAAGKRPATSLAPAIILRKGRPYLALGSAGGAAIPNIVLRVFLGVALQGRSLPDAVDAPRYDQQASPDDIAYERSRTPPNVLTALTAMGHGMAERQVIGDVHAILFDSTRMIAVSDPRHGGAAGGF